MAGIPLQRAPCLPPGSVHVAVTGTAMHWVADSAGLASTGSVFPGYPDHIDEAERRAWREAAARQWQRLLEIRAMELAPGGRFIAALPASPAPDPERTGLYVEIIGDMNRVLADWRRAGRIGAATVAAVVVPVWMRTLDEIRDPFEAGGGRVAGLELESAELFRLDNPYWHDDPAVFARGYVRSVLAWGGPLLHRAFAREGEDRARGLLADFLRALEERVADAPDRYRWDYIEALVICRKADGTEPNRTRALRLTSGLPLPPSNPEARSPASQRSSVHDRLRTAGPHPLPVAVTSTTEGREPNAQVAHGEAVQVPGAATRDLLGLGSEKPGELPLEAQPRVLLDDALADCIGYLVAA